MSALVPKFRAHDHFIGSDGRLHRLANIPAFPVERKLVKAIKSAEEREGAELLSPESQADYEPVPSKDSEPAAPIEQLRKPVVRVNIAVLEIVEHLAVVRELRGLQLAVRAKREAKGQDWGFDFKSIDDRFGNGHTCAHDNPNTTGLRGEKNIRGAGSFFSYANRYIRQGYDLRAVLDERERFIRAGGSR